MKKTYKLYIFALILALTLILSCGCGNSNNNSSDSQSEEIPYATKEVNAMDTSMSITAYSDDQKQADEAVEAAAKEVTELDLILSTGKADSEIAKLNETGSAKLSEVPSKLVKKSLELGKSTDGTFDISIYPLMVEWGFTTKDYHVPKDSRISQLLDNVDYSKIEYDEASSDITLPDNMQIDLGGIAKGYASARIMEIFKEHGIKHGLVSLGGNVQLLGSKPNGKPWKVGIEPPEQNATDTVGVLEAEDCAVITSGGYRRFFEENGIKYHHIIDPKTGKPAHSGLSSVTIVSKDGTLADGLSTSLYIMGEKGAVQYWQKHSDEFEMILVREDSSVLISKGLENSFTTSRSLDIVK